MAERKPISKKVRFEVFKRDRFTCQYCGRMSPDVILEVDHIKPVADGGTNKMINLVTSCRDCNRGKGKRKLSDDAELKKQQKELIDLADKREQSEMMIKWRDELTDITAKQIKSIDSSIELLTGSWLSEHGERSIAKLIKQFSFIEVSEAVDIAFANYKTDTDHEWEIAFNKIGGICFNRRKQKQEEDEDGNI